jgi:hypothetical protein
MNKKFDLATIRQKIALAGDEALMSLLALSNPELNTLCNIVQQAGEGAKSREVIDGTYRTREEAAALMRADREARRLAHPSLRRVKKKVLPIEADTPLAKSVDREMIETPAERRARIEREVNEAAGRRAVYKTKRKERMNSRLPHKNKEG